MSKGDIKFVYFGTPQVSVRILDLLEKESLKPALVVTSPDKASGRGMKTCPPAVKIWAEKKNVRVLQPEKLKGNSNFVEELKSKASQNGWDVFVVVAYGKIIPKEILDIPSAGSINLHYSLLPKLRGPAPVEGAILHDEYPTGVTTILMDEEMDHGPVLLQEVVETEVWPPRKSDLFEKMNKVGGRLLSESIRGLVKGQILPQEQDHDDATYVKMIKKEDGLIDLEDADFLNWRKFLAYEGWPKTYFLFDKNGKRERVIITDAEYDGEKFKIKKVVPEGKKEMTWKQFQNWYS